MMDADAACLYPVDDDLLLILACAVAAIADTAADASVADGIHY